MKNQEMAELKLAEMAGKKGEMFGGVVAIPDDSELGFYVWSPLNDMNQALEVWRAVGHKFFSIEQEDDGTFTATLSEHPFGDDWISGNTEAEALCSAMLAIKDGE